MKKRLPPGQRKVDDLIQFNIEKPQEFDPATWKFTISGEVEKKLEFSWKEFLALPNVKIKADFHCVTGWSRFDNIWRGVLGKTICEIAKITEDAKFVIMIAYSGYTSNVPLDVFQNSP